MDSDRFDTIARALTNESTRRTFLGGGLGGLLAGLLGRDETVARKGKKGKGKGKRKGKGKGTGEGEGKGTGEGNDVTGGNNTQLLSPNICANGIQDAGETDVDCGGSCPRCSVGKTCASRDDCESAVCTAGTCDVCSGSTCGLDADGKSCYCDPPAAGGPSVCNEEDVTALVANCADCPSGTTCVAYAAGDFFCYKPCRAA